MQLSNDCRSGDVRTDRAYRHDEGRLSAYPCAPASAFITLLAFLRLCPSTVHAQLIVDCSGSNPSAYPTINAALSEITGPGATVLISGVCTAQQVVPSPARMWA